MTQKELLYVEDAVGHESNIIKICENTIDTLEDEELVSFMDKELKKHTSMHKKLISLLEEKSNE